MIKNIFGLCLAVAICLSFALSGVSARAASSASLNGDWVCAADLTTWIDDESLNTLTQSALKMRVESLLAQGVHKEELTMGIDTEQGMAWFFHGGDFSYPAMLLDFAVVERKGHILECRFGETAEFAYLLDSGTILMTAEEAQLFLFKKKSLPGAWHPGTSVENDGPEVVTDDGQVEQF